MTLLRMFLWILLLPMGVAAIMVPFELLDRDFWSQPNRFARFLGVIAFMLPGISMAYALLVDWNAVIWVGISFLTFVLMGAYVVATQLRTLGMSIADIRAGFRTASRQARDAQVLVTGAATGATRGNPANAHPDVTPLQQDTSSHGERHEWWHCARMLTGLNAASWVCASAAYCSSCAPTCLNTATC